MDLSKSIRRGLVEVNKPKYWLAGVLDVSPQYVSKMCNGHAEPNIKMVRSLASAFGVKVSVFIEWGE